MTRLQYIYLIIALIVNQFVGQIAPGFNTFIATPILVPLFTLYQASQNTNQNYYFERCSLFTIAATGLNILLGLILIPYHPEHIGGFILKISYGFTLLTLAGILIMFKLLKDFKFEQVGWNSWTALCLTELSLCIGVPLLYYSLVLVDV